MVFSSLERILVSSWTQWSQRTGVAGASNISKADNPLKKLIWFLIFVAGLFMTVFYLVEVILSYRDYNVTTTISLEKQQSLSFPAVTVCNRNRINCGRLDNVLKACQNLDGDCIFANSINPAKRLEMALKLFDRACVEESEASSDKDKKDSKDSKVEDENKEEQQDGNVRRRRDTRTANDDLSGIEVVNQPLTQDDLGEITNDYLFDLQVEKLLMFFYEEERMEFGHSFQTMVVGCTFKNRNCLVPSQFWQSNHPAYGNCYTFNSALSKSNSSVPGNRVSSLTGPSFGLSLILNIEQDGYMVNNLTKQAGARVVVHTTTSFPLVSEMGRDVMPNTQTALSIKEVQMIRQKEPYRSACMDSWQQTDYGGFIPTTKEGEHKPGWNYTLPLCQRICLRHLFLDRCGCMHPSYADSEFDRQNIPACVIIETKTSTSASTVANGTDNDDGTDMKCMDNVYDDLDNGGTECQCRSDCYEKYYDVDPSTSLFPSDNYEETAEDVYGFTPIDDEEIKNMYKNLLEVKVFFSSLSVETITENRVYDTWYSNSFISALGGALSLWLGISMALVFEIAEFFIDLVVTAVTYVFNGRKFNQYRRKSVE